MGTAFDFLLRFELVPSPNLYLAMLGAELAGRKYVALLNDLVDRLRCMIVETAVGSTSAADVVSAPPRRDTELVAAAPTLPRSWQRCTARATCGRVRC